MHSVRASVVASGVLACLVLGAVAARAQSFTNFESGHVRPLALSPDGSRLFAVNTPDNRLAIYSVGVGSLTLVAEVPVGLEPVAVAARTNTEVWVVNHLSDSLSIVQVDTATPSQSHVVQTLFTCDEPRDIVFAGTGNARAFVTTARRGQNCPVAANLTTAGTSRALVQVWDATNPGAGMGGAPLTTIQLFGDTPRALARSTDGTRVYAAVFQSGNRTTTINQPAVSGNGQGLPPDPVESTYPTPKPAVGLVVKFDTTASVWRDERPTSNWNSAVPFSLPDRDVFIIDATANPPAPVGGTNSVVGVGTILFNMAVRPNASGQIYVANLDARNNVRFEPRITSTGGGVQGHIAESRITVINGTTPTPHHLNPDVDYTCVPPGCPNDAVEIEQSLAFPMDMTFSANGARLYVVGLGSEKIGIFDAAQLEAGNITPATKHLVEVGGGPSGLALDETRNQLYVMNRFDHTISIVANASNPATAAELAVVPLRFDPSPPAARVGRRFLYDARHTSAHGDSACASCHIFGDFDSLAWDLSNPLDPNIVPNDNPFRVKPPAVAVEDISLGGTGIGIPCDTCEFHPMKGPMTTQTLRGMAPNGPMHWRGDRTGGTTGQDPLSEDLAFKAFNPAFVGLLGHDTQLSAQDMQDYTNFILSVALPPNPLRNLDETLNNNTASESQGSTFFTGTPVDAGILTCEFCHRNPLGSDGLSSFEGEPQEFKIAHLRNIYQKVGMFAVAGDQVRGFGYLHDGSVATVFNFLQAGVFQFGQSANTKRRNLEAFIDVFDSGIAPAVGQQVTVTSTNLNDSNLTTRIDLLIARDEAARCDLVVKGRLGGVARGWVYVGGSNFQPDRNADPVISTSALRGLASTAGQELTYTCAPLGSGARIGVDRDGDGTFDQREIDCGTDPANPASVSPPTGACGGGTTTTSTSTVTTSSTTTSTTSSTTTTTVVVPTTTSTSVATTSSTSTTTVAGSTSTTTTVATTSTTSSTSAGATTTSTTTSTTTTTSGGSTTTLPIVLIQSTSLNLRDRSTPPADPNRRKISFKSTTVADAMANRIVVPARGSTGDPTTPAGAVLEVYNSSGTGEKVSVTLPFGGWTAYDSAPTPKGYRYKSPNPTDPITRVTVKPNQLRIRGGKSGWTYTLDEASQGSVAVRLTMGTGFRWCANSPAKSSGNPANNDRVDKFSGERRAPAPGTCPAVP